MTRLKQKRSPAEQADKTLVNLTLRYRVPQAKPSQETPLATSYQRLAGDRVAAEPQGVQF